MTQPDRLQAQAPRACGICALIERIRTGAFPDFVAELPHSFVILGDAQFYRGYCVVFAKLHATELHLMPPAEARALFEETVAVGAAIAAVVKPLKLNHECLGNAEPHVHWHVFPRYASDPMQRSPIWSRSENERKVVLDERDRRELIGSLRTELGRLVPQARFEPPR
jgi:diadenosine tetraphosphate (Ap4A) HIT family hydrolase